MLTFALYLYSLLHLLSSTGAATPPYTPSDYFLLNCGSSSKATSRDGRSWDGEATSKFSPSNIGTTSSSSTATEQNPSVPDIPFLTARIFTSEFTYTFPVSSGPKFLRLYFYPATYSNHDRSKSYFSVTAANYTLLNNFSAFLTVSALGPQQSSLVKEYIVNVRDTQKLDITFNPSPNSYAFINGIEVVSIPNNFYMKGDLNPIPLVGTQQSFYIDNNTALETLYRLNVGGNEVSVNDDTGMYRPWRPDDMYIYGAAVGLVPHLEVPIRYTNETPNYTAPATVYTTARTMGIDPKENLKYNLTWIFTVDSGFLYLVRLHFCEFQLEVTTQNERIFSVYMNNQTADAEVDVIYLSGDRGIPVFKDYVLSVPAHRSKVDLWLAVHPNIYSNPRYADAILNGLEIFKLNRSGVSLARPIPTLQGKQNSKTSSLSVFAVAGGVIGGVFLISVIGFLIFRRRWRVRDSGTSVVKSSCVPFSISYTSKSTKTNASSLPPSLCGNLSLTEIKSASSLPSEGLCRRFSLAEIQSMTNNFDDELVIGSGGFGKVYKGLIDGEGTSVAIKRLNSMSKQGAHEFWTEIEMLSNLRHNNLVSLIGYCEEGDEMILVYEYIENGTLADHLYKINTSGNICHLSWEQRLNICIGVARGLDYLHTSTQQGVIHRDMKTTNILLDKAWVAKISDFGLCKMGITSDFGTHISTDVKGTFGYMDPEYFMTRRLTKKSDVYAFGVVLLEVLCGRPAVDMRLEEEQCNLVLWAQHCMKKKKLGQIIDPSMRDQISPHCLKVFVKIVDKCLHNHPNGRPTMADVVVSLECALAAQDQHGYTSRC